MCTVIPTSGLAGLPAGLGGGVFPSLVSLLTGGVAVRTGLGGLLETTEATSWTATGTSLAAEEDKSQG